MAGLYTQKQANESRIKQANKDLKKRINVVAQVEKERHTIQVLKLAYRFASGDMSITSEEMMDAASDALSNEIGVDAAVEFLSEIKDS